MEKVESNNLNYAKIVWHYYLFYLFVSIYNLLNLSQNSDLVANL